MQNNHPVRERNQTLECIKLIAAVMIVCCHVGLPGKAGELMDILVRFSLPVFFSISGYFSFGLRSSGLIRRFRHIVYLTLIAMFAQVIWWMVFAAIRGNDVMAVLADAIPSLREFANIIFLHLDYTIGHLWYLYASASVYLVMAIYVRFFEEERIDYRPVYFIGAALFAIRYIGGDLIRKAGVDVPYYLFRDGWFFGLPMFAMGLFIREYHEKICRAYCLTTKRLFILLSVGIVLSLLQHETFGTSQLPFGAVIQAFALMMLALRYPRADFGYAPLKKLISTFGVLSTTVYITHFCVYDAYAHWVGTPLYALLGYKEKVLRPFLIAFGGCIIGWMICLAAGIKRRITKK